MIGQIENMPARSGAVRAIVMEWDRSAGKVLSGDRINVGDSGLFAFVVNKPDNCHVCAFADRNSNDRYDPGEPAWIYGGSDPKPVVFDGESRRSEVKGRLSNSARLPDDAIREAREFIGDRKLEDVITAQGATLALGEVVDPAEQRFAATTGREGMWTPASFAFKGGLGIYFLDHYDPGKIPVLFVYGAAGSPQDSSEFFKRIDRRRYQPWFYVYPTGARLERAANVLNEGIKGLHAMHRFRRLHVVAHSMGGLVARRAVMKNVLEDGNGYINRLVTISSPFGGHEAAEMGVEMAPWWCLRGATWPPAAPISAACSRSRSRPASSTTSSSASTARDPTSCPRATTARSASPASCSRRPKAMPPASTASTRTTSRSSRTARSSN